MGKKKKDKSTLNTNITNVGMIHPKPNHDDVIVVLNKYIYIYYYFITIFLFHSNKSADKKLQMNTATLKVPNLNIVDVCLFVFFLIGQGEVGMCQH